MTKTEMLEAQIKAEYEAKLDEDTGQLYNRFVSFISEARIPLYNALVVLEIVKSEVIEQIKKLQGIE